MKAYVLINASPGRALEVAKKMEGVSGITAADAITGEYDVIAVCEAQDVNSIGSLIVDKTQKIDGVSKPVTCLAVKWGRSSSHTVATRRYPGRCQRTFRHAFTRSRPGWS